MLEKQVPDLLLDTNDNQKTFSSFACVLDFFKNVKSQIAKTRALDNHALATQTYMSVCQ